MTATLAVLEGACLFLAVLGATLAASSVPGGEWHIFGPVLGQTLILWLCALGIFYLNDLYDLRVVRSLQEFAPRLIQALGVTLLAVAVIEGVLGRGRPLDRLLVFALVVIGGLMVTFRVVSYSVMRREPFVERTLIVGVSPLTHRLLGEIEAQPHRRLRVVGVADDAADGNALPVGYPLLGPLEHLGKVIEEVRPHRVVVALAEKRGRLPVRQLLESRVRGIPVEDGVRLYERLTGKVAIESLAPSGLVFSEDFRSRRLDAALGRALSLAISLVGLLILAPVCLLIAMAIKIDSSGPVLFIHERVGMNGRRFRLLKFRTMHPDEGRASEWERDNAGRITRVGQWLRKFRMDEIPQFVNILRGEMNLVGPRPHPVSNFDLFTANIPFYWLRCMVRPGVTGWAQVRYGYANDLSEEIEKMRYDLYYIKRTSLELDLRILFETVKIVLFGREGR